MSATTRNQRVIIQGNVEENVRIAVSADAFQQVMALSDFVETKTVFTREELEDLSDIAGGEAMDELVDQIEDLLSQGRFTITAE